MPDPIPDRVEELFGRAAELPPGERAAFLDAECGADARLRAEVEELLALDAGTGGNAAFLESPLVRPTAVYPPPAGGLGGLPAPAFLGRYRVVRRVGEGGMGVVYEAEQDNPRRVVALKVIRPGLASANLLRRFANEAQILGRLQHPGIAQVFEAGTSADGQPFFAMEFVRGEPLDEYCRRIALPPDARLELVTKVCEAVQHAHARGVVHRDLKPGNILVGEDGQPKVLDFGIARVVGEEMPSATARTRTGQMIGTLGYMSPEQVAADPAAVDPRSDVYALGVILFELLAGRPPYPLDGLPLPEAARVIREVDPPGLGGVAARFRGDVETIVAKALEKDRGRRYPDAGELAADLRRHLARQPIRARPASALYHLLRFARRNTLLVGAAATVAAALIVGTVSSVLFALDARASARSADANARSADANARTAQLREYQARLAAAVSALSGHDVASAGRHLQAAPAALRGWEWDHLHARLDDSTFVQRLPPTSYPLSLSGPGGLWIGLMEGDGLRFVDENGRERKRYPFVWRGGQVIPALTGDSLRLATCSQSDRPVLIRDEVGRVLLRVEADDMRHPMTVLFTPDRARLAVLWVGKRGPRLRLYDAATGEPRGACDVSPEHIDLMAFSPDGTRAACGGQASTVQIWDVAAGRLVSECAGHTSKLLSLAFRPDGKRLLTTSHDGTVRQWDPATGREAEPAYDHHPAEVYAAVYSPDGQRVASGGADRTVRVWRATGRQDLAVLRGHEGAVHYLAFTPDGRRLVSGSRDLSDARGDSTLRTWEVAADDTLPVLTGHTSYVYPVAYSPDGRWLASGAWDKTVRLWDAATGQACVTFSHPGVVRALAIAPDGRWLVAGVDAEENLYRWDMATGRLLGRLRAPGDRVHRLAVSPDGERIATACSQGGGAVSSVVIEVATGRTAWEVPGTLFAYSPDGGWLAGSDGTGVVVYDARTGEAVSRGVGHDGGVTSAAFSPDGRQLLTAGSDRTVRLWDTPGCRCVRAFEGHSDEVFAAVFHPDGKRIASGGRDRAVWLWDPETGLEVARLPGHTSYIWSLAFSPDGHTLASGSGDGTVRLWDTTPLRERHMAARTAEALRPEAEALVGRLAREHADADGVVAAFRADVSLDEAKRQAAFRAVFRLKWP